MQFTLRATRRTPHGASRLVQAMPAWLVKTRRAPFWHSRDARVYGRTTTAMHKLSTPPPALPSPVIRLQDIPDKRMHFLSQPSDFVQLKNGFYGLRARLIVITLLTLVQASSKGDRRPIYL